MLRFIILVLLSISSAISFSAESQCSKLVKRVVINRESYRPPMEGKIIGNNKNYFYSSPDLQCKMKGTFVVEGDSITVYGSYKDWFNVMYIATTGEDYVAWIPSKQVKITGQYGNNP